MKKTILYLFLVLLLSSCNSSKSDSNYNKENKSFYDDLNNLSSNPYYYTQWYINSDDLFYKKYKINANASINAQKILNNYSGKTIKIAIIDDGLDTSHEDLKNLLIKPFNSIDDSRDVSHTYTYNSHGTAVTGIIAASNNNIGISGIAYNAQIIFIKYNDTMSDSETIELFTKAEEFGADIINCSWGTHDVSESVKETIIDLSKNGRDGKGTIIVFASGNDNKDMGNDESNIKEVISVGSSNSKNLRSSFSNFGENLDILAPGGYVDNGFNDIKLGLSTLDPMYSDGINNKNYILSNEENTFIGTSASAPIVSAVIALMLEKNPNLTKDEIENIIKTSTDKIGEIEYINNYNKYYGYGKINLAKIMEKI